MGFRAEPWCILFAACLATAVSAQRSNDLQTAPEIASGFIEKKAVIAKKYMVVAAHPLASEAGLKILDKGGSALDAAIAVQLVLNLVEPQSSGIGGGAFMLHFDAKKNAVVAYDGRGSTQRCDT